VCGERVYDHVHGGEDGGLGAAAEVGTVDPGEASYVFGRERPPFVALAVMFQVDCMCTSYRSR